MSIHYPEPKKDHIGLYFDHLPKNFRLASIDDFHVQGKKKIGMIYLVQWNDELRFSFRHVDGNLTGSKISPFIKQHKVFVLYQ